MRQLTDRAHGNQLELVELWPWLVLQFELLIGRKLEQLFVFVLVDRILQLVELQLFVRVVVLELVVRIELQQLVFFVELARVERAGACDSRARTSRLPAVAR